MLKKILISIFVAFSIGNSNPVENSKPVTLMCYVGGTMRPALEILAKQFEDKTGTKILVDYSSSGEAIVKLQQTGKGDLICVHDPYEGLLKSKGLLAKSWTVASLRPTIVVPKGNPKKITDFRSLLQPGVRVVLTDPVYSTLGHIITVLEQKGNYKEALEKNVITRMKGSAEAANAVAMGTADAAIVWNAVAFLRQDKLDTVHLKKEYLPVSSVDAITSATFGYLDMSATRVTVTTLTCSKNPDEANAFGEFIASKEGAKVWLEQGFSAAPVSLQSNTKLTGPVFVYCAAGMRKPIEILAKEFEKNTGCKTEITFDGSNKLLGQMELARKGDVYITGDADYIEMAKSKGFIKLEKEICYFVPVIMVKKGNPLNIKTINNLTNKGVKIGQGDERSAAVGRIIPKLLTLNNIDPAAWKRNVVVSTATVNELGNAVKLGTIDAAIVWNAIAATYSEDASVVKIDSLKNVFPKVGGAVLTFTKREKASVEFLEFITSDNAHSVLKDHGYTVRTGIAQ